MRHLAFTFSRLAVAFIAGLAVMLGETGVAFAQSQNCSQIVGLLRAIENNNAYRDYAIAASALRDLDTQVRQAESLWIRGGCQQALNSGQALSRDCRTLAQNITAGRNNVQQLTQQVREGQGLMQHRETLLQEYARFSCNSGQSGVSFGTQANFPGQRGSLLDQIFGGGEGYDGIDYRNMPYDPWTQFATRRTVCVRTCDGFYWPISFSTVDDYVGRDAIACHEMCPGAEVLLFSYRNPGEEPEDMISLSGAPYRNMPYAFQFRETFNKECSCQQRVSMGNITLSGEGEGGRAVIAFDDMSFPLPQRDPRRTAETTVAEALYVPLPRPRPREDGTFTPTVAAQPSGGTDLRIVNFGDRRVRIVGPETPYVPGSAGAS